MKRYVIIATSLIIILLLIIQPSHSVQYIAEGSNFQLYFSKNTVIAFQHLPVAYQEGYIANVTVSSGTLNGTNGQLEMGQSDGILTFLSQDVATLTPGVGVAIILNDVVYDTPVSISATDNVIIKWAVPYIVEPAFPLLFVFGMAGLISMFVGPLYTINKWKKRHYYNGFVYGLTITVVGFGLFLGWLWS